MILDKRDLVFSCKTYPALQDKCLVRQDVEGVMLKSNSLWGKLGNF
jgi:hypothetical protein